jgi:ABC-type Na+ efflux pump permease subunit
VNARKVLRIARWEVTKNAGGVDRRTLVVAGLALLAAGAVAPYAASQGVALDSGIYRVGVSEDSPYHDVVASDPTFVVAEPSADALADGRIDVLIRGQFVTPADTQKGRAALAELQGTVQDYNDEQMRAEDNQSAAFPVAVSLRYVEREQVQDVIAPGRDSGTDDGDDGGTGGPTDDGGTGTSTDGGDTTPGDTGTPGDSETVGTGGGGGVGGLAGSLGGGNASGTPSDIAPPFPFQSLVLAFLFILPMNFIIQAYGSTMLSERLNRRGELLLVSPVSRFDIIAGKTLPYFATALGIVAAMAVALQYPTVSVGTVVTAVVAITPIALLFLSATFLGAMFARSFKELTFVTVTVTVSLTTYAFVPAIFTDIGAIALISPLTIVVRSLQTQPVALGEFAFSVVPPTLAAGVLFMLGAGLYREEDMFTQRAIPLKVLDALAARTHGKWSVAATSALLLPFVFVTELVGVALLFAVPQAMSIPAILVVVAVVEEVAKSLHVYAGYAHSRFEAGVVTALVLGAFSGFGFFVGEKLTLLAQLVGLTDQLIGRAALVTGTGPQSIPVVLALLLAPLVLHAVTAAISAVGASRGRQSYGVALGVAVVVHFLYNFTVVMSSGAL